MIVVNGLYKMLELHDPSLLRARVGGHWSFRRIGPGQIYETETCLSEVRCSI